MVAVISLLAPSLSKAATSIAFEQPPDEAWHGVVLAEKRARIVSEIDGRVAALPVPAGTRVAADDDLAFIDVLELEGELARAEAALALARADLDEAAAVARSRRSELERRRSAGASVSREDLGAAQGQYEAALAREASARARLRSSEAERSLLAVRESRMRIKAPMPGIVGIHQRQVGDGVQRGTVLMELADDSSILVRFAVPAEQSSGLRMGQEVGIHARDRPPLRAHVVSLAPGVDPLARLLIAEARLHDPAAGLLGHAVRVFPSGDEQEETADGL